MPIQTSAERVLVVSRVVLDKVCPRTFNQEVDRVKQVMLENCNFVERDIAENDSQHKQIIPYVVIRHLNQFLLIQRTTQQTETRLHNLYSLGVGGHVNDDDMADKSCDVIASGMKREFDEEIKMGTDGHFRLVGVINDDSTNVARFHVGFVYLLEAPSPDFTILELGKYTASWKSPDEIAEYYGQMESWAQIVYDFVISSNPDNSKKWETTK